MSFFRCGSRTAAMRFGHTEFDTSRFGVCLWIRRTALAALADGRGKQPMQFTATRPQLIEFHIEPILCRLPADKRSPGIVQARRGQVAWQIGVTVRRALDKLSNGAGRIQYG